MSSCFSEVLNFFFPNFAELLIVDTLYCALSCPLLFSFIFFLGKIMWADTFGILSSCSDHLQPTLQKSFSKWHFPIPQVATYRYFNLNSIKFRIRVTQPRFQGSVTHITNGQLSNRAERGHLCHFTRLNGQHCLKHGHSKSLVASLMILHRLQTEPHTHGLAGSNLLGPQFEPAPQPCPLNPKPCLQTSVLLFPSLRKAMSLCPLDLWLIIHNVLKHHTTQETFPSPSRQSVGSSVYSFPWRLYYRDIPHSFKTNKTKQNYSFMVEDWIMASKRCLHLISGICGYVLLDGKMDFADVVNDLEYLGWSRWPKEVTTEFLGERVRRGKGRGWKAGGWEAVASEAGRMHWRWRVEPQARNEGKLWKPERTGEILHRRNMACWPTVKFGLPSNNTTALLVCGNCYSSSR